MNAKKPGVKKCHFYRTHFSTNVVPDPETDAAPYEYEQVKRWTKKGVPENSIFACDALFFPCNVHLDHWILIVAFMKEKTIQVFDSCRGKYEAHVRGIYGYLVDEHRAKMKGVELPDQNKWKLYPKSPHCPAQGNGFDCGVFVCMYADYISNGWPLVFNQSHINSCCKRITLGILQNCAVTTKAAAIMAQVMWLNPEWVKIHFHKKFVAYL